MADDLLDDIPDDDPALQLPATQAGGDARIELKSMNTNLGAQRMAMPRNMAMVFARIDQAAQVSGARWRYAIPFKDKRTGKTTLVTGPTIGCALDVARAYGNCTVDVERVEDLKDGWVMYGVFLDIENGFRLGRPFRQRRAPNIGNYGGDGGRAEDITFQIGASKAIRNVTVNALRGIIDEALDRADNRLTDKIAKNREAIMAKIGDRLLELKIDERRVERFIGRKWTEMKPVHIAQVIKLLQAIADDMIAPDEAFPKRGAHDTGDLAEVKAQDDAGGDDEGSQEFAKGGDEASRAGQETDAANAAERTLPTRDAPQGTREAPPAGHRAPAAPAARPSLPAGGAPNETSPDGPRPSAATAAHQGTPAGEARPRARRAATLPPTALPPPPPPPPEPPSFPTDDGWPDVGDEPEGEPLFGDEQ